MKLLGEYEYSLTWLCALVGVLLLAACGSAAASTPTATLALVEAQPSATSTVAEEEPEMAEPSATPTPFELSTNAFGNGEVIPDRYACTGENISPDFSWGDPPAGTQSLVLLFDDPDAFGWVHWLVYNLPADLRGLPEGLKSGDPLPVDGLQGTTSFNSVGYGGPCPPAGAPHTYSFRLYALDTMLDLEAGVFSDSVENAMEGHILAETEYTGQFSR